MTSLRPFQLGRLLEIGLVWLVFALLAGRPIPDENEPHYLGKLQHSWQTERIQGDLFLDSREAHQLFFYLFGWPSRWLSLYAMAMLGRAVTWLLLAIAWQGLIRQVVGKNGWAVPATVTMFVANDYFNLAGEWVVGGFEAKSVAYAFVFFALWAWFSSTESANHFGWMWLCLGIATSLHPLVGGWMGLAIVLPMLVIERNWLELFRPWPEVLFATGMAFTGLLPAALLDAGADPETVRLAHRVYVFERLPHHLLPLSFTAARIAAHGGLILLWCIARWFCPATENIKRLDRMVAFAIFVAIAGLGINIAGLWAPDWSASLLRFYWFRLTDVIVPLALTITILTLLVIPGPGFTGSAQRVVLACWLLFAGAGLIYGVNENLTLTVPRTAASSPLGRWRDWQAACRWAGENTPRNSIFVTPLRSQTFKWYSGRPECVTWKDIPQDAASIMAWRHRIQSIFAIEDGAGAPGWYAALTDIPPERWPRVAQEFGAQYVLTKIEPVLPLERVFHNNSYAIYRIEPNDTEPNDSVPERLDTGRGPTDRTGSTDGLEQSGRPSNLPANVEGERSVGGDSPEL